MLAVPPTAHAARKFSKFTLAAAVVLAAAFGAMAGVLGATGVARLAGDTATTPEPTALQTTLAQLRSEVAALKASVDTTSRNTGAQYSKLVERFDRVERTQSGANKSDAVLPKETTGSVTPPGAAAALPPAAVAVIRGQTLGSSYTESGRRRHHQSSALINPLAVLVRNILSTVRIWRGARAHATRTRGAERARAAGYGNLLVVDRR